MASREEQEYSSQAPAGYIGDLLQSGIFPYARTFLDDQFNNLGRPDSSPFTYTGPRVAQFDPRERYAMDLQDAAIGSYRPYLGEQAGLLSEAADVSRAGTVRGADEISQGLISGRDLTNQANITGQRSTRSFDPRGIGGFYNPFEIRVGLNTGYCNVGNFGSSQRLTYTIIGGEVNVAARLEAAGDAGGILMSYETYAHVQDMVEVEEKESVKMKGINREIKVFSVLKRRTSKQRKKMVSSKDKINKVSYDYKIKEIKNDLFSLQKKIDLLTKKIGN